MVPDGWRIKKLGQIARVQSGSTPSRSRKDYFCTNGLPWVKTTDLTNKNICKTEECVTDLALRETGLKVFPAGTVLVAMYGGFNQIGRTGMLTQSSATNQAISALVVNEDVALPEFLLNFLNGMVTQWRRFAASSRKDPNITRQDVCDFRVLLPPTSEQGFIAATLSVWDQAIETTKKLIENSEAQKKALMQQLLTGKKRLPGFNDEWQEYCLGELGTTYGGLSGKSKTDFGKGRPYIPYLNVFRNSAIDACATDLVEVSTNENQNAIQYGDILFTTSSETPEEVGMSSVVLYHPPVTFLNSFCFGFRPHTPETLAPEFARFLFRGTEFRRNISRLAQGSTRFNLSKRYLLKVEVSLPPIDEQLGIARVLSLAEQEVRAQYLQLVDLQLEKRALMQQLLTGKRRVKVAA